MHLIIGVSVRRIKSCAKITGILAEILVLNKVVKLLYFISSEIKDIDKKVKVL